MGHIKRLEVKSEETNSPQQALDSIARKLPEMKEELEEGSEHGEDWQVVDIR